MFVLVVLFAGVVVILLTIPVVSFFRYNHFMPCSSTLLQFLFSSLDSVVLAVPPLANTVLRCHSLMESLASALARRSDLAHELLMNTYVIIIT